MMKPFQQLWRNRLRRKPAGKRAPGTAPERASSSDSSIDWLKVCLSIFTIAALSTLMSVHLMPDKIALHLGDVSPREVRAGRSVIYINSAATHRLQRAAALGTHPVYDLDESASINAQRTVRETFDSIELERTRLPHHLSSKPRLLQQTVTKILPQFGPLFTLNQLSRLLLMPVVDLQNLRAVTLQAVNDTMEREIRDRTGDSLPSGDLERARQNIVTSARTALARPGDAAIVGTVASNALRANRLLDTRRTDTAREAAERAVPSVYEPIARGDRIIASGETVSQEHLDKFTALGLQNPHLELTTGAAVCVLAAAMVLLVVLYIARSLPRLYADRKRLALLSVIVILSVIGLKLGATMLGLSFSSGQLGYLGMMSVAAAGMLVSVLLDMHLAVLVVALLAVQSGLIMNHEIRFTVMTLMSSLVAIASVGSARSKINLVRTTVALSAANLALVWLLGLLLRDSLPELLTGSAWAVGSAAFATFLFWFGVLMLEKPFGILTHTALLELSAFDQPLLRQLCAVAPGTYAHSMMVGTLAESGAQAVGAEALLCRVGGYYHDIGKIKRPDFFVENQRRENVHGRLSPSLSVLIITAHVRDGAEMARENRLPEEIRDIIEQHHGTTLIRYFYHQALTDCGEGGEVPPGLEERFRYPGPKPKTREAAIVMLADSVEAAARSLDKPSQERLEALITGIVRDKIEDGQFDTCPLTFRDVKGISDAFLHVLTAMMHGRIDYPAREPRNATGQPMEVVRPDLRPQPGPLSLPATPPNGELAGEEAYPDTDSGDLTNEVAAVRELIKARTSFDSLHERLKAENGLPSAMEMEMGAREALTSHPLSPEETEAVYGDRAVEHAVASDTNNGTAAGGTTPAPNGKTNQR